MAENKSSNNKGNGYPRRCFHLSAAKCQIQNSARQIRAFLSIYLGNFEKAGARSARHWSFHAGMLKRPSPARHRECFRKMCGVTILQKIDHQRYQPRIQRIVSHHGEIGRQEKN